jgi:4-hydroxythreonine-4-phosphate dehydrogenase
LKKKLIFIGDIDSTNIEIIYKSHKTLKNKVKYILLCNIRDLKKCLERLESRIIINEIYNPLNFQSLKKNCLNCYNIEDISKEKYKNLINQINLSNYLANYSKIDLVTMPINKSIFKKKIEFTGMTEYLAKINNKNTFMIMVGEKFSIIPLTTHINLKDVNKFINKQFIQSDLDKILKEIKRKIYDLKFKSIKFLCFNPHCSEGNTIGKEDKIITNLISNFKKISGPYPADSAFNNLESNNYLFISMYHDQALIPFKILNKKGINLTMGLEYRRLSPAHGTARDIKFKNIADISSYLACMEH